VRICVDLDGVVCRLKSEGQQYADLLPVPGVVERLRELRQQGHYIIIHTARHMKTCAGNVGRAIALQGGVTLDWLRRHEVEYDELYFGKPEADVYLDDNAWRFSSWDEIASDGSSFPLRREHQRQAHRLTLVMPMAGRGQRFVQAGERLPKPLIPVRGRPMYSWAMAGLPLGLVDRVIFVCLREHLTGLGLEHDIRSRYAHLDPVIVPLDGVTEGQACTVLAARASFEADRPLLIFNADTHCRTYLERTLRRGESVDGVLGVFRAAGDKWNFARTDDAGRVVETAEKRRISDWASTGLYYFRRTRDFVEHAEAMIAADERVNGEFYVAPIYNRMIAAGAVVRVDPSPEVWPLGTPEDLAAFELFYPP
jgi:capsule biosynthesis phosphatase